MKMQPILPIPVMGILKKLGHDISEARRRRRITIKLLAERARISRATVGKIEKGDPSTSLGAYAAVLFVLGMTERLGDLADPRHDLTGLQLATEQLPKRVRLPRRKNHEE